MASYQHPAYGVLVIVVSALVVMYFAVDRLAKWANARAERKAEQQDQTMPSESPEIATEVTAPPEGIPGDAHMAKWAEIH